MSKYWSGIVSKLSPYKPGEQPRDRTYIKLNTNENPYPPSPSVSDALKSDKNKPLNLYPDPSSDALKRVLAKYYQLATDSVFIGNGSDEVLAHAFNAFFSDKAPLLFPDISYSFYPVYCQLYGIKYETIALENDFTIKLDRYQRHNGGVIFPNPNAPTGSLVALNDIEQLLKNSSDSVVIVDEAYIDFGGVSAIPLIKRYPNLLVIQTLSKSRSLAGLRLGYALGDPQLIEGLERVKNSFNSYPVNTISEAAAIAAFEDQAYFEKTTGAVISTRNWTCEQLQKLDFKIIPSQANFLFVTHPQHRAEALYQTLRKQGILVRHFNSERTANYLRISIGTGTQMQTLISKLRQILEETAV